MILKTSFKSQAHPTLLGEPLSTALMGGGVGGGGGGGLFNKQKKGRPRNNQKQNEQTDSVARRLKLTPEQQQELHRIVQLENWGYREIYEFAKEWFGK